MDFAGLKAQYARIKPEIARRIQTVLDHGQFILGPEVSELETALAKRAGTKHAIGVSSGTDALVMALMAEGIGTGDAVFVPSFTFTASAEVVLLLGATPVFVDVDPHNFNIDTNDLDRRVSEVAREGKLLPRAVIAVDLFGQPADYGVLENLCRRHALYLIADAAQSYGAKLGNRAVGALAHTTAASFFPAKPLGAYGDGGALFTDDDERTAHYKSIRAHGKGTDKYDIVRLGLNARLDTLQAAILLAKLDVFDDELAAREKLARAYDARLKDKVEIPHRVPDSVSAWAQYCILVDDRDTVAKRLKEAGVPTAVYYPLPMHLQTAYARFGQGPGSLPISERLSQRILALPMNPYLTVEQTDYVCTSVAAAVQ
ncbi:MAG: DegT/DnrJ/EryC1/StrS aminotransferase family protein [Alphaproteobacteria bacterium]|nr:DegT/DnrJ/EryC1/StrS aminotransferase family protein [Alphaproteobacteria bacterium]